MQKERPLSPHLQVYKPQMTSMLSILHRGTGVFLALCTPFIVYWLAAIAAGPTAYSEVHELVSNWFVKLVLIGWAFATFYHMSNGIRHLFWDAGKGFEMQDLYRSGYLVIGSATILTAATAIVAFSGGLS